ncbi:nuclear transport factor 2 family protein [Mycolicibacterium vaccae]|uniref:nuclear transport factor 2 family protein n=1 Tax=Mycolicibacterium vaccae TaxID=1810 RepID=UPI003D028E23
MSNTDHTQTTLTWDELPAPVTTYLVAHRDRDADTARRVFSDAASITDEGRTHTGRRAVDEWLGAAGSEYTYTTEFRGAARTGATGYDVVQRLEGDFPGGVADLHFRFTLSGELITRLVIEP